jgi:cytochrome c
MGARGVHRSAWALACAALLSAAPAFAAGDAKHGGDLYEARCGACHSVAVDRIGPRHAGVVGRRAGSVKGFEYSAALASSKLVWDANYLERWLTDSESLIPGQRMGYRVGAPKDREDIVAYLARLKP